MNSQTKFSPIHPGKIIERRFFKPRNLTIEKVAKDTCLPPYQLQELVEGKRNNDQFRICFIWESGKVYQVELVDYHKEKK